MVMVGVDWQPTGELSPSRLGGLRVGDRMAPFYIHQMNRVNSRNGSVG